MKHLLVFAAMAAMSLSASAQFSDSGSGSMAAIDNDGWSTVYVEWNPTTYYYTGKSDDYDDYNFNAFSLGYSRAFALSQTTPLYLEAGGAAQYGFYSDEYNDTDIKYRMLSLKVPVNLMYKWSLSSSNIDLIPFLGLSMRCNIWGEKRYSYSWDEDDDTKDLFDKKDMGKESVWKRFQIGWQIGLKARFNNKFIIGGSYGTDFNDISKKFKFRSGSIMIGYTF